LQKKFNRKMIADAVLLNTKVDVSIGSFGWSKARAILVILAIVLFCLIGFQFFLANYLATQGQKASELESKIKSLQEENKGLKMQIDQKGSLKEILEKSKEFGFKKPENLLFVKENFAVAKKM